MKGFFPYAEETAGFIVRVSVNYLPEQSQPDQNRWFWAYHIRIENESDAPAQLLSRFWEIGDMRGAVQYVEGEGVVGEQPVIRPGRSFDYVSGCPLATPGGSMRGHYWMIGESGARFQIAIPRFQLKAPVVKG